MKCKFCDAELETGVLACPFCGQESPLEPSTVLPPLETENIGDPIAESEPTMIGDDTAETIPFSGKIISDETKPKKSVKLWIKIISVVTALAVVVALLFAFGILPPKANDLYFRDNYTVEDWVVNLRANQIVATVGSEKLSNDMLQVYYWMFVSGYLYDNQYYLSYLGLDYSQPLHKQISYYDDTQTWQQTFLTYAFDNWYRYTTLCILAQEEDYKLEDSVEEALSKIPEQLAEEAQSYGYDSAEQMLSQELGPTCSVEDYIHYMRVYYTGYSYFSHLYDGKMPTQGEIDAYFAENEEALKKAGITKDEGELANIRHILLEPEDTDENGQLSDDEWAACEARAQALLDQWLRSDPSETAFSELANAHSADPGSNTNGGLYTGVAKGDMVEEFDAWLFEDGRKAGDYGIVKTKFGYHIMYFSGSEPTWIAQCREGVREEYVSDILAAGMRKWPIDINYKNIVLADITFS